MKVHFRLLSIATILILLQSCASFKPSSFDHQTKRYNDYKKNYSIELQDGYSLISSDLKEKIRKMSFPGAPTNTVMFFNKEKDFILGMSVAGKYFKKSHAEIKELLASFEKRANKACDAVVECNDMNSLMNKNSITVEFTVLTELKDGKTIITFIPFKLTMDSPFHEVFIFRGSSKLNDFEELKKGYLNMLDSLLLPAFTETERKPN